MKHSVKSFSSLYFVVFFLLVIFSVSATLFAAEVSQLTEQIQLVQTQGLKPFGTAAPVSSGLKISPGVLQKVKSAIQPIPDPLSHLDSSYNQVKQLWSSYQSAYSAFKLKFEQCSDPNKAYTKADQQTAGCLPSDTVDECSAKLLKWCSHKETSALYGAYLLFVNWLRTLMWDSYYIACKQCNFTKPILDSFYDTGLYNYCQPVTLR